MSASTKLVREPRPSEHIQRKVISWKVQANMQLKKDVYTWKSSVFTCVQGRAVAEPENDPEQVKTQVVFKLFRSILYKLTPEKLEKLVKQVTELDIDTEERLRGVIELTFEKAISELSYSGVYARMCHGLMALTVQTPDGLEFNFNKLLLKRCQKAFEDKDDNEILKKKQEELEAASGDQEKKKLTEELEEIKYKAKRESVGTMKFIGELFKLKMLIDAVMFDCIGKLLKDNDEVSLECLCTLVSTIGKDLDLGKSKTRLDGYFSRMKQIVAEQTSNRIRFRLQDVLDLRFNKWVPRHKEQGPKTISQIHKETKLEGRRFNQQPNRRDTQRFNQQPNRRDTRRFNQQPDRRDGRSCDQRHCSFSQENKERSCETPPSNCHKASPPPSNPQKPSPPPSKPHQPSPPPSKPQKPSPLPSNPQKPSPPPSKPHQPSPPPSKPQKPSPPPSKPQKPSPPPSKPHQPSPPPSKPPKPSPPPSKPSPSPSTPTKPSLTEEQLEKKFSAIIEEYMNINDMKNVEFTLGEESKESQEKELSSAEQKKQLDTLIQDKADNHTISDWIENNLDEQQTSSNTFIRTLTTCICQSTIISGENCYIVDHDLIRQRATLLQKYLQDEKKQLQALSALQALMVQMDHPSHLLRMFFDCLYDFDVIAVRTYFKWELNKDPTKPQGKDVALQSVTGFFAWLHEVN